MIRLYEEQERQRKKLEGALQNKQDLALKNRMHSLDRKENAQRIPFQDESIRDDFYHTIQKSESKVCKDNLKICEESLSEKLSKLH